MTKILDRQAQYTLDDLRYLMGRLREPDTGCPWDIKQDFTSIAPSTIEESYELADAILRKDYSDVKEECGDVLFQVIYYAELGSELPADERFDWRDIVHALVNKLIRRHPHVFPEGRLYQRNLNGGITELEQSSRWEQSKALERSKKGLSGFFDDIPHGLPAASRAKKMQKRAAQVGFDWPCVKGVLDKLEEELAELKEAIVDYQQDQTTSSENRKAHVAEELGDVFFTMVNLSRHLKIDFDITAMQSNQKFASRFESMLTLIEQEGVDIKELESLEWESYWRKVKTQ